MCHSFNDGSEGLAPPWELQRQLMGERSLQPHNPSLVLSEFGLSKRTLREHLQDELIHPRSQPSEASSDGKLLRQKDWVLRCRAESPNVDPLQNVLQGHRAFNLGVRQKDGERVA